MRIPPTQPECCVHFGCHQSAGHHVRLPQSFRPTGMHLPLKTWIEGMDGRLHDEGSDRWLTHWFEAQDGSQMTFIARRDHTVDSRPGSWCGFLMPGNSPLATALRVAREAFPYLLIWSAA